MPQVTDPSILSRLNGDQVATPPVFRTPRKQPAEQRPADATADALANRGKAIDNKLKERDLARGDLGDAAAEERKNAGFLRATILGHNNFTSASGSDQAPSFGGDAARDIAPDAANIAINSPARQQMEQAKESFIRGVLRLESGAVINDDEYARAEREFFPKPGDSSDVIEKKRLARIETIAGFRLAAGILGDDVVDEVNVKRGAEQSRLSVRQPDLVGGVQRGSEIEFDGGTDKAFDRADFLDQKFGITPQNEQAIVGFFNANRGNENFSVENVLQFYGSMGISPPAAADLEQMVQQAREGSVQFGQIDTQEAEAARIAELEGIAEARGEPVAEAGAGELFKQNITAKFQDEAEGVGGAIVAAVTGQNPIQGYRDARDTQRLTVERARENSGGLGTAAEIAGGLLSVSPTAKARLPASIGQAAREGAAVGGLFGAGEGEGLSGTATNALLGGSIGAGVGSGINALARPISRGVNAFQNRASRQNRAAEVEEGRRVVEAGERVGIPVRQPDARPSLTDDFVSVATSPSTGQSVRRTAREDANQVRSKVSEIGGEATTRDKAGLGDVAQKTVERHRVKTSAQATALYGRVDELTGSHSVAPSKTASAIDDKIAELQASAPEGNASEVRILQSIKSDFEKTGLNVKSLQAQRKAMRKRLSEANIDQTADEKIFTDIMDAAAAELEGSLASNPAALGALKNANQFWRDRREFRQQVARKVIGTKNNPVPAETAAKRIDAMMKEGGDFRRFRSLVSEMDDAEKATFRASVAENLGKDAKGEFSLAALAKNINNLSGRSKATLFGNDAAKALNDLATVSRAKAGSTGRFNGSPTGAINQRQSQFYDIMLSIFSGGSALAAGADPAVAMIATAAGAGARKAAKSMSDRRKAKLLLNTSFTKWLRSAPKTADPKKIDAHFRRLDGIAARETVIANDIQALQNSLREAFTQSSGRLAASPPEE